jgi:hypothetical protein
MTPPPAKRPTTGLDWVSQGRGAQEDPTPIQELAKALRSSSEDVQTQRFKSTPVTIGLLVVLLGTVGTIGGLTLRGQSAARDLAVEVVQAHTQADVDRAHPDLTKRYTTRVEHVELTLSINARLSAIEALLAAMRADLEKARRGK